MAEWLFAAEATRTKRDSSTVSPVDDDAGSDAEISRGAYNDDGVGVSY